MNLPTPALVLARAGASSLAVLLIAALIGCPRSSEPTSSGSTGKSPDTWVVFEVSQKGTGNSLEATVWPSEQPEYFETVVEGEVGASTKFFGLGRTEQDYGLRFEAGRKAKFQFWTPGHEMNSFSLKLRKGENRIIVELGVAEVEDGRVPERIRTEVLQSLPSQGPKSGS